MSVVMVVVTICGEGMIYIYLIFRFNMRLLLFYVVVYI